LSRRAVFLDRDGTINEDVGYPNRWDQIKIYPWSVDAVRRLNAAGFAVLIVTNQSGVGRGYYTEDELGAIHDQLVSVFAAAGARIDGIYYCPHYPLSAEPRFRRDCLCRKPGPGMGLRAAADFDLDLARSYMVGDKAEDILFARSAGATPVLVLTGYGLEARKKLEAAGIAPAAVTADLGEAADWILGRDRATTA
jgi:D-glycero-D-manno-heptose 1,7-bisphosphate phosphatase